MVHRFLFAILFFSVIGTVTGKAQQPATPAPVNVLQTFNGTGPSTTQPFQVPAKWEIRWHSGNKLNVTVYSADHTVIGGGGGFGFGSFFLAAGGTYYLQIDGAKPSPVSPNQNSGSAPASGLMNDVSGADKNSGNANPNDTQNGNTQPETPKIIYHDQSLNWNIQVVALAADDPKFANNTSASSTPLAATPGPGSTSSVAAPVPPATSTPGKLTDAQSRAVVLITGDNAVGTGFLVKGPDGPVIVTNIHVISNNPNIKATTTAGAEIKILSAKGAANRDLAMLSIQDANYSYLELATDIGQTVQAGDEVITPGNSQGGGVVLNTSGKVLGIGPDRIEFDNPIYHGNSGGPIFHTKSGKVLGVVTEGLKVDVSDALDKASFASRNSAITGSVRYFGMRLDTVTSWVPIDWGRFQYETAFLDKFNLQSRSLDSYLNRPDPKQSPASGSESKDANLYLDDAKITAARNHYIEFMNNDSQHKVEALKELVSDLNDVADIDMDYIQDMNNFHVFDQERAKDEIEYRKALKSELDDVTKDIQRADHLQ